MKLLVTGGAGFIGSNFVRYWLEHYSDDIIINIDLLTYAGNLANLEDVAKEHPQRYAFVRGDITNASMVDDVLDRHRPDAIVHFAAESHNSRAVLDPSRFFRTNVLGTQILLEGARRHRIPRFHHISTCEVFGDLPLDSPERFTEEHPYRPRTPYNASKAGADHAVRVYFETFHLPVTISICSNNYGAYQYPEKLIPLFTTNALEDKPMPLYRSSQNRREWLHVLDHCRAVDLILRQGTIGETYNVGSGIERSVEEIADAILSVLGKPSTLKTYVPDRPGHDRRYLLDHSKIQHELGWEPQVTFESGLEEVIHWYMDHRTWWEDIRKREDYQAVQEAGWQKQ